MANVTEGYVTIPHDTYDNWRTATLGEAYDVDPAMGFGCQCWDYCSEFWWNVGFPIFYPTLAGTGSAYGAWTDREQNAGDTFDLVYRKQDIKRGDIIVFNQTQSVEYGHIGFADEDYDSSHPDYIMLLSQNNGGIPVQPSGTTVNVYSYTLTTFLGAFRYKNWGPTPPPPPPVSGDRRKSRLPLILLASRVLE